MSTWLLVHSPLTGPSVWRPLARAAERRGHQVMTPDATSFVDGPPPYGARFARMAAEPVSAGASGVVIVGHSGAGAFLPHIGGLLAPTVAGLVFVDAILPPEEGTYRTPPDVRARIAERERKGVLDRWLDWWPEEVVENLLPEGAQRTDLAEDMPRVPSALYDEAIPMPAGWNRQWCSYLRLSAAYDTETDEARRRGWPVSSLPGDHLAVYTTPEPVLDELERLLSRLKSTEVTN